MKQNSKFDDRNIAINAWFYYNFSKVKKPLSLEKDKKLELYATGGIGHIRRDNRDKLQNCSYLEMWWLLWRMTIWPAGFVKVWVWTRCRFWVSKNRNNGLTRYHEKDITGIRSHMHEEISKLTKNIMGYDWKLLHLCYSNDIIPCVKDTLVVNGKPFDQKQIAKFLKKIFEENAFGFAQVDIEVLEDLSENYSNMTQLFVV